MKERLKKEKGFYSFNLLTTVFIMGIIPMFIGYPLIRSLDDFENTENVLYQNIKNSASYYINDNPNSTVWEKDKDNENQTYSCVSVQTLLDTGYLKNNNEENYIGTQNVLIKKDNNQNILSYEIDTKELCAKNVKKNTNSNQ